MAVVPLRAGAEHRLPAEVTSFIGRRRETTEARRLLSVARLVTITGVGGVGKSRLALRVALDVRRAFPGGVCFVELADVDEPALIGQALADTHSIRIPPSQSPVDVLIEHLADRRMLIVLDNCEHLLEDCAVLADGLLRALPDLRILATSRQPLGIASEQTLELAPLPVSGAGPLTCSAESDAVRLFAERVAAVRPDFAVTEANLPVVLEICRRLDGLPLAIELAAVRLRALSVEQLLQRLDDRFRLLTTGSRAAPPRQRTLRALIDWSHDLCTAKERLLWQRACVFSDGFTLETAEEVCSGDGIGEAEVIDLITGLVEKSVLIREEGYHEARYRLLDTIRQYGRERLAESGEEAIWRRRHRDHYRDLARKAWERHFGPAQLDWHVRLHAEDGNLHKALEWSFAEPGEAETGLAMATHLLHHWIRYHPREGRGWLAQGLALCTAPTVLRARALWGCAWMSLMQGDEAPAAAMLAECREIAARTGSDYDLAYADLCSGMLAMSRGEAATAAVLYRKAADRCRRLGDHVGVALALIRLCLARSVQGRGEEAQALGEEAVAVCEAHGDVRYRAYALMVLGIEAWRRGELQRAAALQKQSLESNRVMDDYTGCGMNLEVLTWIAGSEERYARVARLLGILKSPPWSDDVSMVEFRWLRRHSRVCEAEAVKALGTKAFSAEVTRGARLAPDEAAGFVLELEAPEEPVAAASNGQVPPLTRRETEIARLVSRGLSNKEIASTLVISPRTAEGHVEHILDKLGFSSRTQIATWLNEQTRNGKA